MPLSRVHSIVGSPARRCGVRGPGPAGLAAAIAIIWRGASGGPSAAILAQGHHMKILSGNAGHDGHIAYIDDGRLLFSIEAEKDSGARHSFLCPDVLFRALGRIDDFPDVVAVSGWWHSDAPRKPKVAGGYLGPGCDTIIDKSYRLLGRDIRYFSSSHERSHILCSYGLSPFEQGQRCYALVWEGGLGAFYHVDSQVRVRKLGSVIDYPGKRYGFLYALADDSFPAHQSWPRAEDAGKLMALAAFGRPGACGPQQKALIKLILDSPPEQMLYPKAEFSRSILFNMGVQSQDFKDLAYEFSKQLIDRFMRFAELNLKDKLPLLISGGCGLNCDWNSVWKTCGLFEDVFVPPCTNDSGSSVGTAVDAMHHYTGRAKLSWDVYAGEEFIMDDADLSAITFHMLDLREVARFLRDGNVIAWVQGRYEIGPRALGNRSLLATPFTTEMHQRLNRIKQRESFRPIAPVCLEEELDRLFEHSGPSPHMLYFQRVKTHSLPAVTHVDGSARVQSVNAVQNARLYRLLVEFKAQTGYGVLCNTSLNFKGAGFINRLSDLVDYVYQQGIDGLVVGDQFGIVDRAISNKTRSACPAQTVDGGMWPG